jgi:hypothetical protein
MKLAAKKIKDRALETWRATQGNSFTGAGAGHLDLEGNALHAKNPESKTGALDSGKKNRGRAPTVRAEDSCQRAD